MGNILIIDDDPSIQEILTEILRTSGCRILNANDGAEGMDILRTEPVDVIFLDVRMPGKGGMTVLEEIKTGWPDVEVVMISGHATVKTAVKAIKLGACDYLEKPFDMSRVLAVTRNALRMEVLVKENAALKRKQFIEDEMTGAGMQPIRDLVEQSAPSDSRMMILGENGTGKELVARMIHSRSRRSSRPFIEVNCAAIPDNLIESELFGHEKGAFTGAVARRKGQFETANGGTLFLDEVADMSLEAQAKVLRVMQEMTFARVGGEKPVSVDVRLISATNKDIRQEVAAGRFREDLYFRLNVIPVLIPPLRERHQDLPVLIDYFRDRLKKAGRDFPFKRFSPEALKLLNRYSWPGNIRELKNFVERVTILSDEAVVSAETARHYLGGFDSAVPQSGQEYDTMNLTDAKELFEKRLVERRLEVNSFNIAQTARDLGIYPGNLHNKIKKYDIRMIK